MSQERQELHQLSTEQHERLARAVMRRQAALSLRVAAIFMIMVLGLPLVNYYMPQLANTPVLGFTVTWLFLGLLFYPITWLLSAYFVNHSNHIEAQCADWRAILGELEGEPLEPEGVEEIKPAFIESDEEEQK